jgi:hypothetical protein
MNRTLFSKAQLKNCGFNLLFAYSIPHWTTIAGRASLCQNTVTLYIFLADIAPLNMKFL